MPSSCHVHLGHHAADDHGVVFECPSVSDVHVAVAERFEDGSGRSGDARDPEDVDEETLPKYLDTRVLPDPDLVIRTSGEARISNFLLWQSAYAEYEFVDTLWPDFSAEEFHKLVSGYGGRERRFGGVKT